MLFAFETAGAGYPLGMFPPVLILISTLLSPPGPFGSDEKPAPVRSFAALFEEAAASDGDEQLEQLFRSRPYEVVYLVDDNLLVYVESNGADTLRLEQMRRAARVADRVFEEDVFSRQTRALGTLEEPRRARFLRGRQSLQAGREAQRQQHYAEAGKAYEEALAAAHEVGDLLGVARAEQALADLAVGGRRIDEGLDRHRRARDQLGRFRHPGELRSCRALALLHERRGEFGKARENLERMLEVAARSNRTIDTSPVREALARVCQAMGDREGAKRYALPEGPPDEPDEPPDED